MPMVEYTIDSNSKHKSALGTHTSYHHHYNQLNEKRSAMTADSEVSLENNPKMTFVTSNKRQSLLVLNNYATRKRIQKEKTK